MKYKLTWLLTALFALTLVGCSPSSSNSSTGYTVEDAQVILDAGVFDGEMSPINSDVLASLYKLDPDTIQSSVAYLAVNSSVSADELAILILTDEKAAQAAETACEQRLDDQLKVCKSYAPAAVPRLESGIIRRVGNTVLLAVGDPTKLPGVVDQLGG